MVQFTQSPESFAREQIAQTRTNRDWIDMINEYWGRRVVTLKGDVIASVLGPWPNGYPPRNAQ